ncbi:MAG: hypothetical protein ASARMPREDX12_006294 [Alectoria sarmentosa]|nr:MAG: hypothetical protein ASARMPREDX12_006294 [Alectoria sarmentosa]
MLHSKRLGSTNVLNASRFFSQRQASRNTTQYDKPVFRRHLVQPKPEKFARNQNKAFNLFWLTRSKTLENIRLGRWSRRPLIDFTKPTSPAPHHVVSATQKWLTAMAANANVVPRDLTLVEFPAGDIDPIPRPPGPTPKRTEEDRRRLEAVLKVRISSLTRFVSPEMMDSIRDSPYCAHDEDVIIMRCHKRLKRKANGQQCFRDLNRFVRNVANEILYRENSTAADEMVHKKPWKIDDFQAVIVSEAERKAMAWNLKKPFRRQIEQRQIKVKRTESPDDLVPPQKSK